MQEYLLLCRSITHAQRMNSVLIRAGVRSKITRPPVSLTSKGCGYAVGISAVSYEHALRELAAARILPERVFRMSEDGKYREIFWR